MDYIFSLLPYSSNKRKYQEEEMTANMQDDRAPQQPCKKKAKKGHAGQKKDHGYTFRVEFLGKDEVHEGQGLLSNARCNTGERAIRLEALTFRTRKQAFRTFRLDLVTRHAEVNLEVDRKDLKMLLCLFDAALPDVYGFQGPLRCTAEYPAFDLDDDGTTCKVTRKGGSDTGTRSFVLKALGTQHKCFDFVVRYICPYQSSLESHLRKVKREDVAAWRKCIANLLEGMDCLTFRKDKIVEKKRKREKESESDGEADSQSEESEEESEGGAEEGNRESMNESGKRKDDEEDKASEESSEADDDNEDEEKASEGEEEGEEDEGNGEEEYYDKGEDDNNDAEDSEEDEDDYGGNGDDGGDDEEEEEEQGEDDDGHHEITKGDSTSSMPERCGAFNAQGAGSTSENTTSECGPLCKGLFHREGRDKFRV